MTDVDVPSPPRTYGIAHRVPSTPMSEWKVKTADQLPANLKRRLDALPPYLTTKRAMEESAEGRSKLYEAAAAGEIRAVKSGATTLWETLSILTRLANLPVASISAPPRRAAPHPIVSPRPGPRRSRRQSRSTPKATASSDANAR